MNKKNVLILFGGVSTEHDVSRVSAASVIKNTDTALFNIITVGITKNGRWLYTKADSNQISSGSWEDCDNIPCTLDVSRYANSIILLDTDNTRMHIDVVFPVMHGINGEDGTIQGLFEIAGVPYVGSGVAASANCMDKSITKIILKDAGIAQAKWVTLFKKEWTSNQNEAIHRLENDLKYPIFIKPSSTGSSIGINKASNISELKQAIDEAFGYGDKIIAEEFISGQEIETAVLGNSDPVASCCGEIKPAGDFYDYESKYEVDSTLLIPADISDEISEKLRQIAINAYKATGCTGLSRIDFFVTPDNDIILNEINTLPGFTSISMYPKLFEHCGIPYPELITKLINFALEG